MAPSHHRRCGLDGPSHDRSAARGLAFACLELSLTSALGSQSTCHGLPQSKEVQASKIRPREGASGELRVQDVACCQEARAMKALEVRKNGGLVYGMLAPVHFCQCTFWVGQATRQGLGRGCLKSCSSRLALRFLLQPMVLGEDSVDPKWTIYMYKIHVHTYIYIYIYIFLGLRPLAGYASLKLYHVMSCFLYEKRILCYDMAD